MFITKGNKIRSQFLYSFRKKSLTLASYNFSSEQQAIAYNLYTKIIPNNYELIHEIWTCRENMYSFNKFLNTKLITGIIDSSLSKKEFQDFIFLDLLYLQELSFLLNKKAIQESDLEMRLTLEKRSIRFRDAYREYRWAIPDLSNLTVKNDPLIKNHLEYLSTLNSNELMISLLPCMAVYYGGLGLYVKPMISSSNPHKGFIEKNVSLKDTVDEYTYSATKSINTMGITRKILDNAQKITNNNIEFEHKFTKKSTNNDIKITELRNEGNKEI